MLLKVGMLLEIGLKVAKHLKEIEEILEGQ